MCLENGRITADSKERIEHGVRSSRFLRDEGAVPAEDIRRRPDEGTLRALYVFFDRLRRRYRIDVGVPLPSHGRARVYTRERARTHTWMSAAYLVNALGI